MNKVLLTSILLVLIGCQSTSVSLCECTDLKSEADCSSNKLSQSCRWDSQNKVCGTASEIPTSTATNSLYCSTFSQSECPKTEGCSWVSKVCTHFTGCSPFKLGTDEECKAVSLKCITDGNHCVELDKCNTYKKEKSCLGSTLKPLCYWDSTSNDCKDADSCEKLPKSLTTDSSCRDQILTCTTNGAGCVTSGTTCADQTSEISCLWDLNKSKQCFWNKESTDEKKCKEKICENAPVSYTSHSTCQGFLDTKICTAKKDGGCKTITTCEQGTIKEGCVINSQGKSCYWSTDTTSNTSTCVVLECKVAPKSITTNANCNTFAPGQNCITQNGGGCVTNGNCSAANVEAACKTNINNVTCFWDTSVTPNICKELICQNLPQSISTAADCQSKIATCTLNNITNKGCVQKTCDNAPKDTTDCEVYYPGNKCIKNKNGGCNAWTKCNSITLESLCIQNISGGKCLWTSDNQCVDLICDNLSTSLITHQDCNSKLNTCTNKEGGGCQTQTCENSLTNDICNSSQCKWKGDQCFEKTCSLANKSTHLDCNNYLNSCTFNLDQNATIGCAQIPSRCDAIFNSEACKKKQNIDQESGIITYLDCGWDGSKCIDAGCTTLSKTYTTTANCQLHGSTFGNCVSANPNGSDPVAGCIVLPTNCSDRKTSDNCEQRFNDNDAQCIWDVSSSPQKCIDRTCLTASISGTTQVLTEFNNNTCHGYLNSCIANNAANGCQAKTQNCPGLVEANCTDDAKLNGHCVYKSGNCVDKTCDNLSFTSHDDCYNATHMNYSCTVNITNNGCQSLKTNCSDYKSEEQCIETISGSECVYVQGKCVNPQCSDAEKTTDYDTHAKCNSFLNTCTVLPFVKTCQPKATNCQDYPYQDNCLTLQNGDKCIWLGKGCYLESSFLCSNIYLSETYSTEECESISYKCKVNGTNNGCDNKVCTDYTTYNGKTGGYRIDSASSCKELDSTCTLDNNVSEFSCQINQAQCSLYQSQNQCSTATEGDCLWNSVANKCVLSGQSCNYYTGASTAICEGFYQSCKASGSTNTSPCQVKTCTDYVKGGSALSQSDCQGKSIMCSVDNVGNACISASGSCGGYLSETNCTYTLMGMKKCFWDSSTCIELTGPTCTKITGKTSLTKADCQLYSSTCTVNRAGTACVEIKSSCVGVDIGDCQENTTANCVQSVADDSTATCADPVTNTACNAIFFQSTKYTHDKCSAINSSCTQNSGGTACEVHTCANARNVWSYDTCQTWLNSCTYSGSGCTTRSATCAGQTKDFCYRATEGECISNGTTCALYTKTCANAVSKSSYSDCNGWLTSCTYNGSGACVTISATCGAQNSSTCYQSSEGACEVSGSSCIVYARTCANAGSQYSYTGCNSWLNTCTWNKVNGCVTITATCAEQSSTCYQATEGVCTGTGGSCTLLTKTCANAASATSFYDCNGWLNTCTWNGTIGCVTIAPTCSAQTSTNCYQSSGGECMVSGLSCVNWTATCANASNKYSFEDCQDWLNTCTWNKNSGCAIMKNKCSDQTSTNCYRAAEGICLISGSSCIKFTECTQITNPESYDDCQSYSTECTIAPRGGCFNITTCSSYKTQIQCVKSQQKDCYWNITNKTCVDFTCTNIEQTISFNTHQLCYNLTNSNSVQLKCTVRNNVGNTGITNGCTDLQDQCSSYKVQGQCFITKSGKECDWVTDTCVDRQCTTANQVNYTSHSNCLTYLSHVKCTVGVIVNELSYTLGGCVPLNSCTSYNYEEQCIISDQNDICGWNGTKCNIKSCSTANPTNYQSHTDCFNYLDSKCTVSDNDQGCIDLPNTCEELNTEHNCYVNKQQIKCYWNVDLNKCITPTCANAPTTYITTSTCSEYLNICTQDNEIPCKTLVCEDFNEITDDICKIKLPNNKCTTDGKRCIKRGVCKQAQNEVGCTFDISQKLCQWISKDNYCTDMNCSTAPIDKYTTDVQCAQYYISKKCMLKTGGGCIDRQICTKIKEQLACINTIGDINGTLCSWDNGNCRFQNCTDFTGNTHIICQGQFVKGTCTAGLNSKCAPIAQCINTKVQAACVYGLDGPCLWVNGTCYPYTRCESISFQSDNQCKVISSNCSIDTVKNKCVPITNCQESNTNGGCITGYDGECIMSQDTNGKICKIKTNCTDASFLTHNECQQANLGCTTDGTIGCIPLADCSTYQSEAGCVKNKSGQTSKVTGICVWDTTLKSCHDQLCSEITQGDITTHSGCNLTLPVCTSNGLKCVDINSCDKYELTDVACNSAQGANLLPCYYEAASTNNGNKAVCRTKKCSDIIDITTCSTSGLSCVSDGTKCIDKGVCSSYTTKAACNAGGTNGDGVCIFKAINGTIGTCSKMTSCVTANNDKDACQNPLMKSVCQWTDQIGTQASTCVNHSCLSYAAQFGICSGFKIYGGATQQVCSSINGVCKETDPINLQSDGCFVNSNYVYTWNSNTNKCQQCKGASNASNSSVNNTNSNTEQGYILGLLSLIMLGLGLF